MNRGVLESSPKEQKPQNQKHKHYQDEAEDPFEDFSWHFYGLNISLESVAPVHQLSTQGAIDHTYSLARNKPILR